MSNGDSGTYKKLNHFITKIESALDYLRKEHKAFYYILCFLVWFMGFVGLSELVHALQRGWVVIIWIIGLIVFASVFVGSFKNTTQKTFIYWYPWATAFGLAIFFLYSHLKLSYPTYFDSDNKPSLQEVEKDAQLEDNCLHLAAKGYEAFKNGWYDYAVIYYQNAEKLGGNCLSWRTSYPTYAAALIKCGNTNNADEKLTEIRNIYENSGAPFGNDNNYYYHGECIKNIRTSLKSGLPENYVKRFTDLENDMANDLKNN